MSSADRGWIRFSTPQCSAGQRRMHKGEKDREGKGSGTEGTFSRIDLGSPRMESGQSRSRLDASTRLARSAASERRARSASLWRTRSRVRVRSTRRGGSNGNRHSAHTQRVRLNDRAVGCPIASRAAARQLFHPRARRGVTFPHDDGEPRGESARRDAASSRHDRDWRPISEAERSSRWSIDAHAWPPSLAGENRRIHRRWLSTRGVSRRIPRWWSYRWLRHPRRRGTSFNRHPRHPRRWLTWLGSFTGAAETLNSRYVHAARDSSIRFDGTPTLPDTSLGNGTQRRLVEIARESSKSRGSSARIEQREKLPGHCQRWASDWRARNRELEPPGTRHLHLFFLSSFLFDTCTRPMQPYDNPARLAWHVCEEKKCGTSRR